MGCFLRCFGSSNGQKRRRSATNRVPSDAKDQRRTGYDSVKQVVYPDESLEKPQQAVLTLSHVIKPSEQAACFNEGKLESPAGLMSTFQDTGIDALRDDVHEPTKGEASTGMGDLASPMDSRSVEKSTMKKVIFDSVVITHEPVECIELLDEEDFNGQGKTNKSLANFSKMNSLTEDGSVNSSLVSYPANHRYQNYRESDEEEDELEYEESDMDVGDSESEDDEYTDVNELSDSVCSMESKSRISSDEQQTQLMAVDATASLSNWLSSPETKPSQNVTPPKIKSQYPLSPKNLEDRPILGALTVEELKLMSTTSSPRSSPTKSPEGMAIIGSVGSRWSSQETATDSSSVSSYKGIPNTTSKYQEDKRVNWHSTPFETRLEKALSRGSARA